VLQSIVLGFFQGLTEFLPVSSSGHLVAIPEIFGWSETTTTMALFLHMGTLLAVLVAFRADLATIAGVWFKRELDPHGYKHLSKMLLLASVPAAIAGLALNSVFEEVFGDPIWVCVFWLVTAAVLVWGERVASTEKRPSLGIDEDSSGDVNWRYVTARAALFIGCAQAVAIFPGLSRSGMTIIAGLLIGFSRPAAARFSFLMSIPIIAGGLLVVGRDVMEGSFELGADEIAGFVTAAVTGYIAIRFLMDYVRRHSVAVFAYYLVGAAAVLAISIAAN